MKVKELMVLLAKCDPEAEVWLGYGRPAFEGETTPDFDRAENVVRDPGFSEKDVFIVTYDGEPEGSEEVES